MQRGFSLWFWFVCPLWLIILSIFSRAYWPFVDLLSRNSIQILCVFSLLSCKRYLYVLNIRTFLEVRFANIFSYSAGCLFTFLRVPIWCTKLFLFMKSNLSIFSLVACLLVSLLRKYCLVWGHEDLHLKTFFFSSKSLSVLALTLRNVILFKLTLVYFMHREQLIFACWFSFLRLYCTLSSTGVFGGGVVFVFFVLSFCYFLGRSCDIWRFPG